MTFQDALGRAAAAGMCGWLANGGNIATTQVLFGSALVPGAQVPTLAAGLGLLALNAACAFDPSGGTPGAGVPAGCYEVAAGGAIKIESWKNGNFIGNSIGAEIRSITSITSAPNLSYPGVTDLTYNYITIQGTPKTVKQGINLASEEHRIVVDKGTCIRQGGGSTPNAPVTYVDSETTCTYNVEHQAWQMHGDGRAGAILKISSVQQPFASGGVISGCNWEPILYITPPGGGGGGGGVVTPWLPLPDGPDGPWWLDMAKETAAEFLANSLTSLIEGLLETRTTPVVYRLHTVCEVDANGEPINTATEIEIPSTDQLSSVINRLDALSLLLQAHKDYRQPICHGKPKSGRIVTVQFQSDASEIPSKNRIRKTLSYRDQTGKTLAEHEAHWANFSWDCGPWIVVSTGLPWGDVKVWASTDAEGIRVISHAAAVAGVKLAGPDHRWLVTATKDTRCGRTGRVYPVKWDATSRLMISMRDGPTGMPDWRRDS